MSLFAPDLMGDEHARPLKQAVGGGGGDSDFIAERPNLGGGANLIEEEYAGSSERTFSDGGAERSEDGEPERDGANPLIAQGDAGEGMPAPAPVAGRASGPGLLSRAWSGLKRGASRLGRSIGSALRDFGFGKLFGNRRARPDRSVDPGGAAEAALRRDYQASAGRTVDDSALRRVAGSRRPWMARLFGAQRGWEDSPNALAAEARSEAELRHMRRRLHPRNRPFAPGMLAMQASRGLGPDVSFMNPTPDSVGYGEGKNRESRPVGYTPNSAWAVPAHEPAPSEQVGANRGVSKSGAMPGDAQEGLAAARQAAADSGTYMPPGMVRGADHPELRASAQERRSKARRVSGDLARVNPQAGANYRMNRTVQKVNAAVGEQNLIPEVPIEDEEDADS